MSSNTSRESYAEISVSQPGLLVDKSVRLGSVLVSIAAAYLFYEYIEYLVVLDACAYERSTRKWSGFIRRAAHKLELITKDREGMYFCYLPMSHGISSPPLYTLFHAVKEALNTNKPASRRLSMSILMELARFHSGLDEERRRWWQRWLLVRNHRRRSHRTHREMGSGDCEIDESDRVSDLNMDIMHFTKEMLAFGVKDLDTMVILHHLIEAIALQC